MKKVATLVNQVDTFILDSVCALPYANFHGNLSSPTEVRGRKTNICHDCGLATMEWKWYSYPLSYCWDCPPSSMQTLAQIFCIIIEWHSPAEVLKIFNTQIYTVKRWCVLHTWFLAGRDIIQYPGIQDDTKSSYIRQNIWPKGALKDFRT